LTLVWVIIGLMHISFKSEKGILSIIELGNVIR
jgi:hypothetical protein